MNKDFKISFDWEVKTAENTEQSPDQGLALHCNIGTQLGCVPRPKALEHNL